MDRDIQARRAMSLLRRYALRLTGGEGWQARWDALLLCADERLASSGDRRAGASHVMRPGSRSRLLRNRQVQGALLALVLLVVLMPVLVAAGVAGLFDQQAEDRLRQRRSHWQPARRRWRARPGLYAAPLELTPGRWYEVGATEYGGPGDPSSGDYGSIPNPGESYLPRTPTRSPELSVLDSNPANSGTFTFADANALNNLPYLTQLRVEHAGRQALLAKRDMGYGQGPGQFIANGQPYRLDVWWQAAHPRDQQEPSEGRARTADGSAATLGALPGSSEASGRRSQLERCPAAEGTGQHSAAADAGHADEDPAEWARRRRRRSPQAVKRMVAAGNRLFSASYLYGGAHGSSLDTLQPAYDCSSAVSYVLHAGGVLGARRQDSSELESYGQPGPGQYVSIYANAAHTFVYIAGLRFDTVEAPAYDTGPNSGKPGPKWRVSPTVPDWATWTVRHPAGPMSKHAAKALTTVCVLLAAWRSRAAPIPTHLARCRARRAPLPRTQVSRLHPPPRHLRRKRPQAYSRPREGARRVQRALLELDLSHAELKPEDAGRDVRRSGETGRAAGRRFQPRRTRRSPAGISTTAVRSSASPPMHHAPARG